MKNTRLCIEILGIVIIAALIALSMFLYVKNDLLTKNCEDFGTNKKSAQTALYWGNTHLDGDKDGNACQ